MADHALMVDEIKRRPAADAKVLGDWAGDAFRSVPDAAPADLLRFVLFLDEVFVSVAVDADQGKGSAVQALDERPLVREHGPTWTAPMSPEVEQHHLAAIVRQSEFLAVDVLAGNVRHHNADNKLVYG